MDIKKEIWVNQETGEVIETDSITKDIKRNNFMITYMTYLIDVVEILGTKKMMVFKYILENMDKGNNTLIITTRELAEETKISRQVIIDTLKLLEERGLIVRRSGSMMLNPKLIHRGSNQKEKYLLTKFKEF